MSARGRLPEPAAVILASMKIPLGLAVSLALGAATAPALAQVAPTTAPLRVEDATPSLDELLIEVVDASGGEPVPRAEVWVVRGGMELSNLDQIRGAPWARGAERWLHEHGVRHEADEAGLLTVRGSSGLAVVGARREGLFGMSRRFPTETGPLRIELLEDRAATIRVVDETGRPRAGVRVEVATSGFDTDRIAFAGETRAPDGTLEIPNVAWLVADHLSQQDAFSRSPLYARLGFPSHSGPHVEIQREPGATEELVLPLVPTATLHVELKDWEGEPYADDAEVYLAVEPGLYSLQPDMLRGPFPSHGGAAVVTPIEPGIQIHVFAQSERNAYERVELSRPAPEAPGDVTVVEVTMPPRLPVLKLRANDQDGDPLGDRFFRVSLTDASGPTLRGVGWSLSDERGLLTLPMPLRASDLDGDRVDLLLEAFESTWDAGQAEPDVALRVRFDVTAELELDDVALGDVTLQPLDTALVVTGRLVDDTGAPVLDHVLDASALDGPEPWSSSVRTGDDGSFEIHGPRWDVPFRLTASRGHGGGTRTIRIEREVHVGDHDVELVLERTGEVRGRILLAPEVTVVWDFVHFVQDGVGRLPTGGEDGHFVFENLAPGTGAIGVGGMDPQTALAFFPVRIEPGQVIDLGDIDLRERLFRQHLTIRDEDGHPVEHGVATFFQPGTKRAIDGGRVRDGVVETSTRLRVVDVVVAAPGKIATLHQRLSVHAEIVMRRSLAVRLVLADDLDPPAHPVEFVPILEYAGETEDPLAGYDYDRPRHPEERFVGRDRSIDLFVDRPGPYRIGWALVEDYWPHRSSRGMIGAPGRFTILGSVERQRFVVPLTATELESGLRTLREDRGIAPEGWEPDDG